MSKNFLLTIGVWCELKKEAQDVREAVFVVEQNVPIELEMDAMDPSSIHVVIYDQLYPVATARLLPNGTIGRMAVRREYRGQGLGAKLLQVLMRKAIELGHTEIVLSAQVHAKGFYQRFGFSAYGPEYSDAGIAHCRMRYVSELIDVVFD